MLADSIYRVTGASVIAAGIDTQPLGKGASILICDARVQEQRRC